MKRHSGIAWTIFCVFGATLGYIGVRALHFNYPILFMAITTAGTMLVVLAFSLLKGCGEEVYGATTMGEIEDLWDK